MKLRNYMVPDNKKGSYKSVFAGWDSSNNESIKSEKTKDANSPFKLGISFPN